MLRPLFYDRGFALSAFQAGWLRVDAARWAALGGCDTARLSGSSQGRLGLAQALGLLRCGVVLVDESGTACWWGYVERVELWAGRVGAVCDLNEMANRVKVNYTRLDTHARAGGVKDSTAWADELASQGIYGVKEHIFGLLGASSDQALAARNIQVQERGFPVARPAVASGRPRDAAGRGGGAAGDAGGAALADVVITLKGWFHSTSWRYYSQPAGLVEHLTEGPGTQAVGSGAADSRLAQRISVLAGGWQLNTVWVKCNKAGLPSDALDVALAAESGGLPGPALAGASVAGADLGQSAYPWVGFVFAEPVLLSAGAYWLSFGRSGAADGSNYYRLKVDETCGYGGGGLKLYDSGTGVWSARAVDADLNFRSAGGMETTEQIRRMAAGGAGGQFLTGVQLDSVSGLYANPYRSGDRAALEEILAQLQAGDASNNRLLVEVTPERVLRVYRAPQPSTAALGINREGALTDRSGALLPAWQPAAGRWAVLESPWDGEGGENLHIKDRVFLEEVEYDPENGHLQPAK